VLRPFHQLRNEQPHCSKSQTPTVAPTKPGVYPLELLTFARRWLYDRQLLIENDRALGTQIVAALDLLESDTGAATVPSGLLDKWRRALAQFRPDGQIQQSWLWEAPAKHSTPQIAQVFERIDLLYGGAVQKVTFLGNTDNVNFGWFAYDSTDGHPKKCYPILNHA
jgi:hypothetical protein